MSELLHWINANFSLVFPFFILWAFGWLAFHAWRRRRIGSAHPPIESSQVLFNEKYVSGFSDKNLWTRIGGAQNSLEVTVLKDAVLIEPISLFKWMLPVGSNDLDHYILKHQLQNVELSNAMLGRQIVRITFVGNDGASRTLQLIFRNRAGFIAALKP